MGIKLSQQQAETKFLERDVELQEMYKGYSNKHNVACKKCGHKWNATTKSLLTGRSGCPECHRLTKTLSVDVVKAKLEKKGIRLIGDYISSGHKTVIGCKCGHKWNTTLTQILHNGAGCPRCAGNIQYSDEKIMSMLPPNISLKGEYTGMNKETLFMCEYGHCFKCTPSNIIHQGHHDCPTCRPYVHNVGFGKTTVVDTIVFKSKLEADCYSHIRDSGIKFLIQHKYPHNSRMKCDFYIPGQQVWIEVSSFSNERYMKRIRSKEAIIQSENQEFHFVSSLIEFKNLIDRLST